MKKPRTLFDAIADELADPKPEPEPERFEPEDDDEEYDAKEYAQSPPPAPTFQIKPPDDDDDIRPQTYLSSRGRIIPVESCEITTIAYGVDGREAYEPFFGWNERGRQRFEIEIKIPMLVREQLDEDPVLVVNDRGGPVFFRLKVVSISTEVSPLRSHTRISATAREMYR